MSAKIDDAAGTLPKGTIDSIVNSVTPPIAKGTPVEQIAVLKAIAQMENATLHPGNGSTSMIEAIVQCVAIMEGADALALAATAADQTTAINKIVKALGALGDLMVKNGPVGTSFADSTPNKP